MEKATRRAKMHDNSLTRRQLETMEFIRAFRMEKGIAPTFQEIADHFGISKISAFERIETLERKGWLRRKKGIRNLEPIDSPARKLAEMVLSRLGHDAEAVKLAQIVLA
jgi:SOS-response transcriptional repressor LexA